MYHIRKKIFSLTPFTTALIVQLLSWKPRYKVELKSLQAFIISTVLRTWLTVMNICVTNDHGYVPLVAMTSRSFPYSRLITGFVTRLTRRVPLVEQELPTLPEHLSLSPVFSGVRVTRSLVLCICFVDRCLSFFFSLLCCLFFFDILILSTSLWYLQTLLAYFVFHFIIKKSST